MLGREGPVGACGGNSAVPGVTLALPAVPLRGARASLLEKEPEEAERWGQGTA